MSSMSSRSVSGRRGRISQGSKSSSRVDIAKWLNCFNTGGTNWDGKPFHKTINVPEGKVQALWIGVDVPRGAKSGERRATVIIRPTNDMPTRVQFVLKVLDEELADRGGQRAVAVGAGCGGWIPNSGWIISLLPPMRL